MDAATQMHLAKILSLVGLIGATIEYAEIIKRRARLLPVGDRARFEAGALRTVVSVPEAASRLRVTTPPRRNPFAADIGWAAVGLISLLIKSLLRAWRAVRP